MTAQLANPRVDTTVAPTGVRWWHEALALGSVLFVALLLFLWQLDSLPLWRDEVLSIVFSKAPLGDLLTIVGRNRETADLANQATYYLLLHFWLLLGEAEGRVRLLSVFFGIASVVPVYFVARRIAGWVAGGLAAGIFALLPFVIHYSQEARGYSLAMLIAGALTWLVLIGVDRRPAWWPWLAYGLLAGVGLYVHFFVGLVVGAHALWLLATRQVPDWRGVAAGGIPFLIAATPLPLIMMEFGGTSQQWIPVLSAESVTTAMIQLSGGLPLLLALTLLGVGAVLARRHDSGIWLIAACIVVPILGAAAVSLVKPMFVSRYLIVVLPFVAVLAACALVSLPGALLRGAAAVALAALLLLAVPGAYADGHQQDWRAAGPWMASRVQSGDRMITGNSQRVITYYLERAGADVPAGTTSSDALADPMAGRVWLVMTKTLENSGLQQRMAERFDVVEKHPFGKRLRIVLMAPRSSTPGG